MKEWTHEEDATILRMLSNGKTRKQIAVHFGVTRNAICGRVHRLSKRDWHDMNPNAETIAAIEEVEAGGGEIFSGTVEEAFEAILQSEDVADPDGWLPISDAPKDSFAMYRFANGQGERTGCIDSVSPRLVWDPELRKYHPITEFDGFKRLLTYPRS